MAMKETNVIEVLQLPYSDALVVRSGEQHVGIDCHAGDRIQMPTELCDMIVGPNIPDVHLLVATSYYDIAVASLLGLVLSWILWISIELETENFRTTECIFLFFQNVSKRHSCPSVTLLWYFGVVNYHLELREDSAGEHGI